MEHKKCLICYDKESSDLLLTDDVDLQSAITINSSELENATISSQLPVIFLLRKFLEVPEAKCLEFLREYGNPCSWIYWCHSCAIVIQEAKSLFDKITSLQKQFKDLQLQSKRKIVLSNTSFLNKCESGWNIDNGPTTIVREWIVQQQSALLVNEQNNVSVNVKIERFESDMIDDIEGDNYSMLDVKLEGNSDSSQEYTPVKNKVKKLKKRSSATKSNKIVGTKSKKKVATNSNKKGRTSSQKVKDQDTIESNLCTEVDGKKVYSCKYCFKEFAHSGSLVIHERIHTGEKPYKCKLCDKEFRASSDLRKHGMIHKGEKKFTCQVCGKGFYLRPDLRKHERIHTGEKNFCCHICGNKFGTAKTLRNHVMTHTGDKPRLCTICGKRLVNNQQLARHLRTHTGERPYACTFCDKRFYDLGGLQKHEMLHRGEKPYVCSTCGFAFTQSSALKSHQRTHVGEKPYKCTVCERRFTQSSTLKIHERTHTGERPFKCSTCAKQFITKSSLTIHEKTHTGQKDYCCTRCGKLFPQTYSLRRHMKKVHLTTNEITETPATSSQSVLTGTLSSSPQLLHPPLISEATA